MTDDSSISRIYSGPLEGFIARRDALAKELRAAGRKDDAATVKALRKPSRLAWSLNAAVQAEQGAVDALVARVTAVVESQSSGGNVRGSIDGLRAAVREFADQAGRAAAAQGHDAEHADLMQAVLAVIGESDAFSALRAGRLVDIPEAGGLDFLTWLPSNAAPARETVDETTAAPAAQSAAALEAAEAALAEARKTAAAAEYAFRAAETEVERAEDQLKRAEQHARDSRADRDRARHDSLEAARAVMEAERVAAEARVRHGLRTGS
jgi:hypothetical protein